MMVIAGIASLLDSVIANYISSLPFCYLISFLFLYCIVEQYYFRKELKDYRRFKKRLPLQQYYKPFIETRSFKSLNLSLLTCLIGLILGVLWTTTGNSVDGWSLTVVIVYFSIENAYILRLKLQAQKASKLSYNPKHEDY